MVETMVVAGDRKTGCHIGLGSIQIEFPLLAAYTHFQYQSITFISTVLIIRITKKTVATGVFSHN
jgi:hypothetical protein